MLLAQKNFVAAGCEAELYHYHDEMILKLFYKKIPNKEIDVVYRKHLASEHIAGVCSLLGRGIEKRTGREYLLFKYIEGRSLADITYQRSLTLSEALLLLKKTAGIMVEMHGAGVIHGDIHAENIMMDRHGSITLIDLFRKERKMSDDIVDLCRLFHEVYYDDSGASPMIRDLFPKKRDAVLRRYQDIKMLEKKIQIFREEASYECK